MDSDDVSIIGAKRVSFKSRFLRFIKRSGRIIKLIILYPFSKRMYYYKTNDVENPKINLKRVKGANDGQADSAKCNFKIFKRSPKNELSSRLNTHLYSPSLSDSTDGSTSCASSKATKISRELEARPAIPSNTGDRHIFKGCNIDNFVIGTTIGTGSYATVCIAKYTSTPVRPRSGSSLSAAPSSVGWPNNTGAFFKQNETNQQLLEHHGEHTPIEIVDSDEVERVKRERDPDDEDVEAPQQQLKPEDIHSAETADDLNKIDGIGDIDEIDGDFITISDSDSINIANKVNNLNEVGAKVISNADRATHPPNETIAPDGPDGSNGCKAKAKLNEKTGLDGPNGLDIAEETYLSETVGELDNLAKQSSVEKTVALKILNKGKIVTHKQLSHVRNESQILSFIKHPFIVGYLGRFQDEHNLYFILEFLGGGELFSYLRKYGRFSVKTVQFYASQVLLALEYLHHNGVIYRDLKPENILLDFKGYIRLVDFGFAKLVKNTERTWTVCGTCEYLAPEIFLKKGHAYQVDFYSLGVLMYELLVGVPPFYSSDPQVTYKLVLNHQIKFPKYLNNTCKDIIKNLLEINPERRLGNNINELYLHEFFNGVNFNKLLLKVEDCPILPVFKAADDVSNFIKYPEIWTKDNQNISSEQQDLFEFF